MAKKEPGTEVATLSKELGLIESPDQLPDHLRHEGPARGNEGVKSEDLIIPRIEVVQSMSPCKDEDKEAAYIPGIKEGDLFNTITRTNYGRSLLFVPIIFFKQWLLWRDRDAGGGFRGAYNSPAEAMTMIKELEEKDAKEVGLWESVETGQHLVAILHGGAKLEQVMLSMAKTKLKISRHLNTLVRQCGADRFAQVYELGTSKETNAQNKEYRNFTLRPRGFLPVALFTLTSSMYQEITKESRTIQADYSGLDDVAEAGTAAAAGEREY